MDGPYMGDEQPDGQQHFEAPPDHPKVEIFVRGVSSAHIIVDRTSMHACERASDLLGCAC